MDQEDVKILSRETVYQGYCRVERFLLQNRLFSGEWSKPYQREVVQRYDAVAALPYDPIRKKIVLIEQFRAPALLHPEPTPWLFELVAGVLDTDEDKETTIRRELLEEAGLECLDLLPVCTYLASPGGNSEEVSIFCAKVDVSSAPEFCGLAEEQEDIRVHVLGLDEVFSMLQNGVIRNSTAIIALQWLNLNLANSFLL
ncbi:MAG: NUDIX domain-containing protein [Gammaproteobacteria bacterium]